MKKLSLLTLAAAAALLNGCAVTDATLEGIRSVGHAIVDTGIDASKRTVQIARDLKTAVGDGTAETVGEVTEPKPN